ncbi:MAG: heme exporter protein CcmD [Gammaproteobacteria bacterium]
MNEVVVMGPYTGYLLVAYGVTAAVLIGNILAAQRQFRGTRLRLREQLNRRAPRRGGSANPVAGEVAARLERGS